MNSADAQWHWLRAQAVNGVWLQAQGRSMWPLIRDGDEVWVRACTTFGAGQVLVGRIKDQWIAHLVEQVHPLQTVSLSGLADAPFEVVLGRVERIRRGSRVWRFPVSLAFFLRAVPKLGRRARSSKVLRSCWRMLRDR